MRYFVIAFIFSLWSSHGVAHFDHDDSKGPHFYYNFGVHEDQGTACEASFTAQYNIETITAAGYGGSAQQYRARIHCQARYEPNNVVYSQYVYEGHCQPSLKLEGSPGSCVPGDWLPAAFEGLQATHYPTSEFDILGINGTITCNGSGSDGVECGAGGLSAQEYMNLNLCELAAITQQQLADHDQGAWNHVVQECEDQGEDAELFALVSLTYSSGPSTDSEPCDIYNIYFTGGEEYDYLSYNPPERIGVAYPEGACNVSTAAKTCDVGTSALFDWEVTESQYLAWFDEYDESGIPVASSYCSGSCRYTKDENPLVCSPDEDADGNETGTYGCTGNFVTNGELCISGEGNSDEGDPDDGSGGTTGGTTGNTGGTDSGTGSGGNTDNEGIISAVDGVGDRIGELQGSIDGIADGLDSGYTASEGTGPVFGDYQAEYDQVYSEFSDKLDDLADAFGASDVNLRTSAYNCSPQNIEGREINLCFSQQSLNVISMFGQLMLASASFTALGLILVG